MIGAGDQPVDLIGFGAEHRIVTGQIGFTRPSSVLETARESFDGAQTPRDAGREQRIDEAVGMRQHRPPGAGGACQTVLNARLVGDRPERRGVAKQRADRGITAEQPSPHLLRWARNHLPQQKPGARHPVIEAQGVHPAFIYNVVHCGPIVRVGADRQARDDVRHQASAVEVAEQEAGSRVHAVQSGRNSELAGKKAAWPRRVHDEVDSKLLEQVCCHLGAVAVFHPRRHRGAHEVMVHIGAQPVIVGDVVVWTRGDKQPFGAGPSPGYREGPARVMAIEREPALQPAAQLGKARDPATVCREVVAIVQPVAARQPLQGEVGQRRARFSDGEAGVSAALEQHDVVSLHREHAREQRARKATADDGYAHTEQLTAGEVSSRPVRLRRSSRAIRSARQVAQAVNRSASQRSAVTTAEASPRHCSSARSS